MILGGGYSLWLFNRVAFGNIKVQYMKAFSDIDKREFGTLLPLIVLTLVMGIYPEIFLDPMHMSCGNLLSHLDYSIHEKLC
jgi:NADH:ubiquinone oxidoreductase subunit 4 (subunit M)